MIFIKMEFKQYALLALKIIIAKKMREVCRIGR